MLSHLKVKVVNNSVRHLKVKVVCESLGLLRCEMYCNISGSKFNNVIKVAMNVFFYEQIFHVKVKAINFTLVNRRANILNNCFSKLWFVNG